MIPNPIHKVLSSIQTHNVRALLMGGQACVLYGAAEFSRDTDFAILASQANLFRLRAAMAELQAEVIAVPPSAGRSIAILELSTNDIRRIRAAASILDDAVANIQPNAFQHLDIP